MSDKPDKKLTYSQRIVKERRDLLDRVETLLETKVAAGDAADYYLNLRQACDDLEDACKVLKHNALRNAESNRFWTAFGVNTPVVAALVMMEPVTGTLALLSTVLTGYAPVLPIKMMLDKTGMGDQKAIKSIAMEIETMEIASARLMKRCDDIEVQHIHALKNTPSSHTLFRMYPSLKEKFQQAARLANRHGSAPAPDATNTHHKSRRFGL